MLKRSIITEKNVATTTLLWASGFRPKRGWRHGTQNEHDYIQWSVEHPGGHIFRAFYGILNVLYHQHVL